MGAIVVPLTFGGAQEVQNSSGAGVHVSKKGVHRTMPAKEKCKDSALNRRHIVFPQGYVFNAAQKEKIRKLAQQIIAKTCSFADGISLILDANGFETTKNILDAFSNITRYICNVLGESEQSPKPEQSQKLKQLFKAYICNVGIEKTDVVFKRLVLSISSTCKIVLKLAPQLIRLQTLSKVFPHVSLLLDITEMVLNYKNFTKDGLTTKNVLKIAAAMCYHIISCATFAAVGSVGAISACVLAIQLAMFFSYLTDEGMRDVALVMQPIDRLWFNKKVAKKVYLLYESACLDKDRFQYQTDLGKMICLSVMGLNLCRFAVSAIIKLIRDSQEISEPNPAERESNRR
ncbi:MAG: hypothetical protein LBB17_03010 [Puniceicoccales bacterium]|nr:hypothetical protein [Puniceicoccales bacterium]